MFSPYKMNDLFALWDGFMYATFLVFFLIFKSLEPYNLSLKCRFRSHHLQTFALTPLFFPSYFQTHPSQSCFMSSVDLHTHFSYQVTNLLVNCPYHWSRNFVSSFYLIFCFSDNILSCNPITCVIYRKLNVNLLRKTISSVSE